MVKKSQWNFLAVGGGKEVTKLMGYRHFCHFSTKVRSHFFQYLDENAIALFYKIRTDSVLISVKLVSFISFVRSIAPPTLSLTSRWSKISSTTKKAICAIDQTKKLRQSRNRKHTIP
ncbi:hypothetical protein [Microcoleus anatoxicus]|uniref:Uncharacterized protein n=1 Tax=Microcoleus anatoxicus PTRS2 TaxID=2705321 RepID=A0ABU8YKX0_9CYAN